tara:strand:+ start:80 stop:481 length:402 start_codon:yes stop_codon:yes gene_type:complete
MPTSANKDIVESKYSKYGENNMIIEGMVSGHEHSTEKTTAIDGQDHSHKIKATGQDHEQEMDCYEVENEQNEYIELIPKPIPSLFSADDTAGQFVMYIFMGFFIIFIMYVIYSFFYNLSHQSNVKTGNSSSVN